VNHTLEVLRNKIFVLNVGKKFLISSSKEAAASHELTSLLVSVWPVKEAVIK